MKHARWRDAGLVALALVITGTIVHLAGTRGTGRAMLMAAAWMPVLLLCEGIRIPLELLATRALYGSRSGQVPDAVWLRVHCVGYAMTTALPAGRAMSETYKAAALAEHTSAPFAAAMGTASQSIALFANGIVSIPCAAACYAATGWSVLTVAVLTHTGMVVTMGVALQLASRSERVIALAARVSERLAAPLSRYRAACLEHPVVMSRALVLHVAARALQPIGLGVLLIAVTAAFAPIDALVAQGVAFVGRSAGDLVPLQLGTTDGGFALAAPLIGITAAQAVAVSLLVHIVQATWSLVGALVPWLWRIREPEVV